VGKAFLSQLSGLAQRFSQSPAAPYYISLVWISTSKKAVYHADYKSISGWEAELQQSTTPPLPPSELAEYLVKAPGKVVLVDNTSSQEVADSYPTFLKKGISIVTPNKKAFSSSYNLWQQIFHAAANGSGTGGYVYHESSVGAGLPVLSTLKDLVETGDEVQKIEGVFSGTMSFLFNSFSPRAGEAASSRPKSRQQKRRDTRSQMLETILTAWTSQGNSRFSHGLLVSPSSRRRRSPCSRSFPASLHRAHLATSSCSDFLNSTARWNSSRRMPRARAK